jgi:hypothetical protein
MEGHKRAVAPTPQSPEIQAFVRWIARRLAKRAIASAQQKRRDGNK